MAIYDPMKDASHIASQICRTPDILKSYLYKKSACSQLHGMNLAEQPLKELMNNYNNEAITNAEIASGHKNFLKWYQKWAKTNNLNNNLDNLVEEETETPDNAQPQTENKDEPVDQSASLPETELKATPTAAAAEELDKETVEKPLSAAVKEEAQKNNEVVVDQNSQTNKTPSTVEELVQTVQKKQNDQQKDNAKINMEIKVIDTQAPEVIPGTHDVLPPFWKTMTMKFLRQTNKDIRLAQQNIKWLLKPAQSTPYQYFQTKSAGMVVICSVLHHIRHQPLGRIAGQ